MDNLGLGSPSVKGLHRRVLSTALEKGSPTRRKPSSSAGEPATKINEAREKLRKRIQSAWRSLSFANRLAGLALLLLLAASSFYLLRRTAGKIVVNGGSKLPDVSLRREQYDVHSYHPLKLPDPPAQQSIRLLHITQSFGPSLDPQDDLSPDPLTGLAIKQQDSPLYNTSVIMPFYPSIKKKYKGLKKFAELNVPMENEAAVNFRVFLQRWNHTSFAETSSYTSMNVFLIEPGQRKPFKMPFKQRRSSTLALQDVYFAKAAAELVNYLTSAEGTTLFDDIMSEDAQEDSTSSQYTIVHAHGSNCALALPFLRQTLSQNRQRTPSIATVYSMHEDLSQELLAYFPIRTLRPFFSRKYLKSLVSHLDIESTAPVIFPSAIGLSADHVVLPSEQLAEELIRQTMHPSLKEAIMPDLLRLAGEGRFHGIDGSISVARLQQVLCAREDLVSADCATDVYALKAAARSNLGIKFAFDPSKTVLLYHRLAPQSLHLESFQELLGELGNTTSIILLSLAHKYTLPESLQSLVNRPRIKLTDDTALAASDFYLPDASLSYSAYTRQIETAALLGIKELPLYTPLVHSPSVGMGEMYNPFEKTEGPSGIDVGWAIAAIRKFDLGKREDVMIPKAKANFEQYDAIYNLALAHRQSISNSRTLDEDDSDGEELAYFAAEEQEEELPPEQVFIVVDRATAEGGFNKAAPSRLSSPYLLHILHSEYGATPIYTDQLAKEGWVGLALLDINLVPAVLSCLEDEERFSEAGSALALTHLSRAVLANLLPETAVSKRQKEGLRVSDMFKRCSRL